MKLLLDTHVLLWWLDEPTLLSAAALAAIQDPANSVAVSAVVVWQIAIKRGLGKLIAPPDLKAAIADCGFQLLPITAEHALRTEGLQWHHRDPFDRMLVAQALIENGVVVSRDPVLLQYGVPLITA